MFESLRYPLDDEHWLRKNLIGGLLTLTAMLAIPAFFLLGYQLRAMKHGLEGTPGLPHFEDWLNMFRTGFAGTFIMVFYTLIGMPVYNLFRFQATPDREFFTLVSFVVTVVFVYFLPAALANYLEVGRFRAGFYAREIAAVALRKHYGINWLKGIGVFVVGGFLTQMLKIVLVGFIAEFYLMVALFHYFGRTVRNLRTNGNSKTEDPTNPSVPAES